MLIFKIVFLLLPFYTFANSVLITEHSRVPFKLSCTANRFLKIKQAKWEFIDESHYNQLPPIEKAIYNELIASPESFNSIAQKCNSKVRCEFEDLRTGENFGHELRLKIDFECLGADSCPNKKFTDKHIAPDNIDLNGLPDYAEVIRKLRKKKGWKRTRTQTFYLHAANMGYARDPNNRNVCVFEEDADKYECTQKITGSWRCEYLGRERARHSTTDGHYIWRLSGMFVRNKQSLVHSVSSVERTVPED